MNIVTQLKAGSRSCFFISPCLTREITLEHELNGNTAWMRDICIISKKRDLVSITPAFVRLGNKKFYTAIICDGGKLVGTSDMTHGDMPGISRGSVIGVHETRYGTIGVMLAHDIDYWEVGRILALQGAHILVMLGGSRRMARAQAEANGITGIYVSDDRVSVYNAPHRRFDDTHVALTYTASDVSKLSGRRPSMYSALCRREGIPPLICDEIRESPCLR